MTARILTWTGLLMMSVAATTAKAGAADVFDLTAGAAYVPYADATIHGVGGDYRFRGAAAEAAFLIHGPNLWYGLYGGAEVDKNAYDTGGAAETMTIEEGGLLAAVFSQKAPIGLLASLGYSAAEIKETNPDQHDDRALGFVAKLGLDEELFTPWLFLRVEGAYRSFASGKDSDQPEAKLLPFTEESVQAYLGLRLRL